MQRLAALRPERHQVADRERRHRARVHGEVTGCGAAEREPLALEAGDARPEQAARDRRAGLGALEAGEVEPDRGQREEEAQEEAVAVERRADDQRDREDDEHDDELDRPPCEPPPRGHGGHGRIFPVASARWPRRGSTSWRRRSRRRRSATRSSRSPSSPGARSASTPDELRAATRRAQLVLAAGGDPHRGLDLDGPAVERLAEELDSTERRAALEHGLAQPGGEAGDRTSRRPRTRSSTRPSGPGAPTPARRSPRVSRADAGGAGRTSRAAPRSAARGGPVSPSARARGSRPGSGRARPPCRAGAS